MMRGNDHGLGPCVFVVRRADDRKRSLRLTGLSACLGALSVALLSPSALAQSKKVELNEIVVKKPKAPPKSEPKPRPRARTARVAEPSPPPQNAAPIASPGIPNSEAVPGGPSGIKGYTVKADPVSTKTNTPLAKVPASVSVVTREALNDRNVQSLNEAITYTPGALTNIYGFDPRQDQIFIRGFTTLYDGVYRDGLRRAAAGIAIPHAEIYGVDSISILRGPAAGLYGLGSPGGIVELISKRPTFTRFQEIQLQIGNFDRYQGNFDIGGPVEGTNGKWAYRLTGVFRDSRIPNIIGGKDDRITIAPAVTFQPDASTSLTILSEYQRTKVPGTVVFYNLPNFVLTPFQWGDPAFNRVNQDEYRVGYAFEHKFTENLKVRQNLRYSGLNVDYAYTQIDSLAANGLTANRSSGLFFDNLRQFSVDNQVEGRLHLGPTTHTLLAGLDYTHVDYDRRNGFGAVPPLNLITLNYGQQYIAPPLLTAATTQAQDQFGQYLQEQAEWGRLFITLTGRHDIVRTGTTSSTALTAPTTFVPQQTDAFSGRAGINYRVIDGVVPYFSYATTFAPNLGVGADGQPFKASRGDQREVGVKTQLPRTNLHVNAAYFDINQSNVLGQDPNSPANQAATGRLNSRGYEVELIDNIAPGTNVTVSYTHLDTIITQGLPTTTGNRYSGIPRDTVAGFGTYTPIVPGPIGGLTLGGGVRYTGTSFADDQNTGINKPVLLFDALLAYDLARLSSQFRGVRTQINVTNIFNRYYQTCIQGFCYRGAPAQVIGSLIYRW